MAGRPIPISQANEMITLYIDYVQKLPVDPKKKTQYVSFTLPEIMEWLNQVAPFSDELRIFLGVNPPEIPDPGRVTVIVWPYKSGQPSTQPLTEGKDGGGGGGGFDPYDDGTTGP